MRRGLWFAAGAGAGIWAMTRAQRAAEVFTAEGLRERMGAWGVGARMFREEVAQGAAEREKELRERLGLVPAGSRELTAPDPAGAVSARPDRARADRAEDWAGDDRADDDWASAERTRITDGHR